jgi:tRNA1(Val) A37 N6-methylase TrmN6
LAHLADNAEDTTEDAFLGGALKIRQPRDGYRASIDSVLLAAAAPVGAGESANVLDAGAGTGVVGLCVAWRAAQARVTLVERAPDLVQLARRNIALNGLENRIAVIVADIVAGRDWPPELAAIAGLFDHVLANPPYNLDGRGTRATDASKAGANSMPPGDLDRWARFLAAMAKPGGSVTMIHRADALASVLSALAPRFGGLVVFPVFPRSLERASRVLVQGVKGSRAPVSVLRGLVLHGAGSGFTPEAETVLRRGTALTLTTAV